MIKFQTLYACKSEHSDAQLKSELDPRPVAYLGRYDARHDLLTLHVANFLSTSTDTLDFAVVGI